MHRDANASMLGKKQDSEGKSNPEISQRKQDTDDANGSLGKILPDS